MTYVFLKGCLRADAAAFAAAAFAAGAFAAAVGLVFLVLCCCFFFLLLGFVTVFFC